MIDKGICRGLFAVFAAALLGGCGLFTSEPSPLLKKQLRPGVDRAVAPGNALPPAAPGHAAYDGGATGLPETRPAQIGSIVTAKGGQQSQKEALEKQAKERDAQERERAARQRAARDPDARPVAPPAAPSSDPPPS